VSLWRQLARGLRALTKRSAAERDVADEVQHDFARSEGTFGTYHEMAQRARSFEAIAALKPWQPTMTGPDQPERFDGQRVSAGYFQVPGVPPIPGRAFLESEDQLNEPKSSF
jgi:hypothetical protein